MDGLADILTAIANAKTPLAIFIILAVVLAAIVWQVSKRAALSEKTTQILVIGGYGLVGLLIAAGVATVFLAPGSAPPLPQPQVTDVTISGKVFAGGDQRTGLVGATVHLEPLAYFPEHSVATDANGEFITSFQAKQMVSGVMWVTEDKYNPTSQAFFSIDPANPAPPKQFIDMGAPLQSVATNTPPAVTAPAPQAAATPAPASPPPTGAAPAAATSIAAHYHHLTLNPALAAHTLATPYSMVAAIVLSPKLAVHIPAANPVMDTTSAAAATFKPRTDYDALFAKIETDEVALSNAATAAFDDGQWAQTIRFIKQAQRVSKTGVWKLTYPKLAAAYFLSGQAKLGHDMVAAIETERAKPGNILASTAAQRFFARDAATMPATLTPADRAEIDSALH